MHRTFFSLRWAVLAGLLSLLSTALTLGAGFDGSGSAVPRATTLTAETDWPTLAHDLRRSGYTATGPRGPYTKIWFRDIWSEYQEPIAHGYQPVVAHDDAHDRDLVYIGVASGALYALDLDTGDTFWRYPATGQTIGGVLSPPSIVGNTVYLAALDGNVYALDGNSVSDDVPALKWQFSTGRRGGFWATPAVTPDTLYIGGRDGYFYALDTTTGAKRWEYDVGAPILTSPAYDNGVVYLGAEDMHAYALRASDGELIWQSSQLTGLTMAGHYPVLSDDLAFFRTAPSEYTSPVLAEGERLLAHAAGCTDYPLRIQDREDAPCFDWKAAASSQADYDQEHQAVVDYLEGRSYAGLPARPQYETFYALRRSDGQKAFTAPVLWTAALGFPGVPPVVTSSGDVWVLYRTYYSDYDNPSWFIMGGFGQMSPTDGRISIHNPSQESCNEYSCNHPFSTDVWLIGDETTAFSIAGDKLFTYHWAGVGSVDLVTHALEPIVGKRDHFEDALLDVAGTPAPRSLRFSALSSPWLPDKGPTVVGGRVIVAYMGVVAVMQGELQAQ
ncbi:MAG: PQQ-binding-like beta-propeller repeat protein [Chloroflexota bacterium]|nr:PQQ-binding-like beta-propeller repeat protein [Chloroflexota bacterium]